MSRIVRYYLSHLPQTLTSSLSLLTPLNRLPLPFYKQVFNAGNSGKTMLTNGLCGPPPGGNCSYWATPTYQQALASTPDIVTIMLGVGLAWKGRGGDKGRGRTA
jgi:hypothetical protein